MKGELDRGVSRRMKKLVDILEKGMHGKIN